MVSDLPVVAAFTQRAKRYEQTQVSKMTNDTINFLDSAILTTGSDINIAPTKKNTKIDHDVLSITDHKKNCIWIVKHVRENDTRVFPSKNVQKLPNISLIHQT